MNKIKSFCYLLLSLPLFMTACTEPRTTNPTDKYTLELTADKETIMADGKEVVKFTVNYVTNGETKQVVTSEAKIINVATGDEVVNGEFTSTKIKEYKFKASYKDIESNEVTVKVTKVPDIILSVDRNVIYNNGTDAAKFTIMYAEQDVTAETVITNLTTGIAMAKGVNTFSSTTLGKSEFKAMYNNMESNVVNVVVAETPAQSLVLTATKPRITPDGSDATTFKVMYLGKDVTADADVKIKNVTTDSYIDGNSFTYSGNLKVVEFEAEYKGSKSDKINIGFGDFYKNVMAIRYTGTWCGPCTTLAGTIKSALVEYPDRLIQAAVHNNDKLTSGHYSRISDVLPPFQGKIPTLYFDFDQAARFVGDKVTAKQLTDMIKQKQAIGAKCGIAASSIVGGETASIDIKVTASVAGSYFIGAMLLEDGLTGYGQNGAPEGLSYVHNDTFRSLATVDLYGDNMGDFAVNQELTKNFTFDLKNYKAENCRILVYVVEKNANGIRIINATSCPVSGSVDYRFEE